MAKHYKGFKLHRGYRKVTVWTFDAETHQLVSTGTSTPFPTFSRKERYDIIFKTLTKEGIVLGDYEPTKSE